MKERARALFKEAIKKVNEANIELYRPEEDVVSVLVCKKSQRATENFLRGFLLHKGIEPKAENTLEQLYKQCLAIDPNFSKIDLSSFICRSKELDTRHCDELSKVNDCYVTANRLGVFLQKEKVI